MEILSYEVISIITFGLVSLASTYKLAELINKGSIMNNLWRVYCNGVLVNVFIKFEKAHKYADSIRTPLNQVKLKRGC